MSSRVSQSTLSTGNDGALDQARLEILLVKEAEQRSSDGIYPRIDQQLLGGDQISARYEPLRRILVDFILTVCCIRANIPPHIFTYFAGLPTRPSLPWKE